MNMNLILIIVGIVFSLPVTHARVQLSPAPHVNQHFLVVADIEPAALQSELEKLNRAGYTVRASNWEVVGDKFTIIVSDNNLAEAESEEEW